MVTSWMPCAGGVSLQQRKKKPAPTSGINHLQDATSTTLNRSPDVCVDILLPNLSQLECQPTIFPDGIFHILRLPLAPPIPEVCVSVLWQP